MSTAQEPQYRVNFLSISSNSGSAVLFQTDDNTRMARMYSLAWFCHPLQNGRQTSFTWSTDYWYVWAETGSLAPGVIFSAAQIEPAQLEQGTRIRFGSTRGSYEFKNEPEPGIPGQLCIVQESHIQFGQAAVGIGMSGSGTFATQAQPSYNIMFAPQPKYWLTFGNYKEGQVLNVDRIDSRIEIAFPAGKFTANVILNLSNTLSVSYS